MKLTPKLISKIYNNIFKNTLWITLILFLLDTYAYFFIENKYLSELFNFASEKTPATWVSSTTLLIIAGSFFLLHYLNHSILNPDILSNKTNLSKPETSLKHQKQPWLFPAFFFVYLSLDDASYLHEQISSWITNENKFISGLPSYGWLYTLAPFIFAGLAFIFYHLYRLLKLYKLSIKHLFITILLLGISITLDFLDGLLSDKYLTKTQTHYMRVSEETIEIIAFAFLLLSVSLLIKEILKRLNQSNKKGNNHNEKIKKKKLFNRR